MKYSKRKNVNCYFNGHEVTNLTCHYAIHFRERFRLAPEVVDKLVAAVRDDIRHNTERNMALTPREQVLVTLRYAVYIPIVLIPMAFNSWMPHCCHLSVLNCGSHKCCLNGRLRCPYFLSFFVFLTKTMYSLCHISM